MDPSLPPASSVSPTTRWSIIAGLYLFACGTATALLLHDVLALLADVIGLPTALWMVVLASPAFVVGAVVWWAVVERRDSHSYLLGGAVGLVTALFTGLLWTGRFATVWGLEMLEAEIVALLVVVVLGLTAAAGAIAGLPLMYARRRLDGRLSGGEQHAA